MQPNYITQEHTSLSQKLRNPYMAQSECTIYRVYGHLRNINDKAYEPEVIAIGPYHRGKDNLKMMEDCKLHYLNLLLQRKVEDVDKYVSAIKEREQQARKCYATPISLDATQFMEMLILDGCFIIELVRKYFTKQLREENDPIFRMNWIGNSLRRDLMLFENQIPFFVLRELFELSKAPDDDSTLTGLLTNFYRPIFPGIQSSDRSPDEGEVKHLLGMIHIQLRPSFNWRVSHKGRGLIKSATSLREANVKFEKNEGAGLFDIRFEQGTMKLPVLKIEDTTESFWRNLIAYEQYFCDTKTSYVRDYVMFFDCLINSPKDVEILSHAGIIKNWLGDDEVVAKIFNKLGNSVMVSLGRWFSYGKIFDEVNDHCNKRWNKWMAKLRRDYLNSPWAIISIIAAVVLLLLTVAQAVFSVLQVV